MELELTSVDLKWCYAASGCDNITGIRRVGFATARSACRLYHHVPDRLPRVDFAERTRIVVRLQILLGKQRQRPRLTRLLLETKSLLHKFVFAMQQGTDGQLQRVRLAKILHWHPPMACPGNTYGLVLPPPPAIHTTTTAVRFNAKKRSDKNTVDQKKAIHCFNYWSILENLEPQQPEQELELEPIEGSSRGTRKKKVFAKKTPKTNQHRTQSEHTMRMRDFKLFYPMVTRTAPTIPNITPIRGFGNWFQTHIQELKVLNN